MGAIQSRSVIKDSRESGKEEAVETVQGRRGGGEEGEAG
jgi:hypothetical protein